MLGIFDVVVVGSCNVDLVSYVPRFPRAGETVTGHKFAIGCGGKGANPCVMAAKLGAKTAMIGRVGDDNFGEMYIKNFREVGVNIDHLKISQGVTTGVAPIVVNQEGENAIVIVKGANDCITQEDLQEAEKVIQNAKVLLCQLEINIEITLAALKMARKHKVTTIFNSAPAVKGLPKEFLENSDILVCNETEAEVLSGLQVTSTEEAKSAIKVLLQNGCKKVILTLGSNGALCATVEDPDPVHVPTDKVKTVDTTGAGDAFVGSLAYFFATQGSNLTFKEMVRRANKIAAISVTKSGTQTSYPNRDDLPQDLFS